MSYFSAMRLMAENNEVRFFSVSIFSSRWAERRDVAALFKTQATVYIRIQWRQGSCTEPPPWEAICGTLFRQTALGQMVRACSE